MTVNRKQLLTDLTKVQKFVSTKNSLSILSHISFKENELIVVSNENEVHIDNLDIEGDFCVDFFKLQKALKNLKSEYVDIIPENNYQLTIVDGKRKVEIAILPNEKFPNLVKEDNSIISSKEVVLLNNIQVNTLLNTTSKSESRRFVSGIFFDGENFVSTDGKQLTTVKPTTYISDIEDTEIVVNYSALSSVKQVKNEMYLFAFSEKYTKIQYQNVTIYGRNIEGNFPPYKRVIPSDIDNFAHISVKKSELIEELKYIKNLSDHEGRKMIARIKPTKIDISSDCNNKQVSTSIVCTTDIVVDIALNYEFILNFLTVTKDLHSCCDIYIKDGRSAILFKDTYGITYLCMPMTY